MQTCLSVSSSPSLAKTVSALQSVKKKLCSIIRICGTSPSPTDLFSCTYGKCIETIPLPLYYLLEHAPKRRHHFFPTTDALSKRINYILWYICAIHQCFHSHILMTVTLLKYNTCGQHNLLLTTYESKSTQLAAQFPEMNMIVTTRKLKILF